MENKFNTALEAEKIIDQLRNQLKSLPYNKDLRKLLTNCEKLKAELGSSEVRARQYQRPGLTNGPRAELKAALDYLEKVIIIATLSV